MHTTLLKKSWLFLIPLVLSLMWTGAAPSRAAGAAWTVTSVDVVGCNSGDWDLTVVFSGVDGGTYVPHTTVTSGGLVYMNEDASYAPTDGAAEHWGLYADDSYGPVTATYPIPSGQPMAVTFSLERPKGTVLYSWSVVAPSCDSSALLLNAPDLDRDFVANAADTCPALKASTANGCPLRDRALTLRTRYGPRRVVGRLYAAGYPALHANRTVFLWRVRPGPDLRLKRLTTNSLGRFAFRTKKGRYYATSPGLVVATAGQVAGTRSAVVRVR